jgi:hypothetical protein
VAEYYTDTHQLGTSAVNRFEGVNDELSCTALAQDRERWQALVLNPLVPKNVGEFLPVNFSNRMLTH